MSKGKKENQREAFIRAAKEHGCDESEEAFNVKLKKLATTKPPAPKKPKNS